MRFHEWRQRRAWMAETKTLLWAHGLSVKNHERADAEFFHKRLVYHVAAAPNDWARAAYGRWPALRRLVSAPGVS